MYFIGIYVGDKHHSEKAEKELLTNIADGLYEQEQNFMSTKREQTGRVPFMGQTGDEVSLHGRTFDLQQYQVVENGRPKQLLLRAAEIKAESVTGQVLFNSSDKNMQNLVSLNQDKDHVKKITVGGCFDGGTPYQGDEISMKGLRIAINPAYRGKHDRMHQHNLSYKAFMAKFRPYATVIGDYRKLLAYFSTSTKKLRRLKGEEVDVDILKEMDRSENLYIGEVKKLAGDDVEAMYYLDSLHQYEELQKEIQLEEATVEISVFSDPEAKTVDEQTEKIEKALECLRLKHEQLENLAKENAERRIRAHKLTRIFEIRMVNGVLKALLMLERRYVALCRFFEKEVIAKEQGSLLCLRILTNFSKVSRFLSLLDITENLTKALCLEKIGSVTVLHLDTLNKRLFESMDMLIDTDLQSGEDISTRFGVHLARHVKDLCKNPPQFKGVELRVGGRGRPSSSKDKLSGIRRLQKQSCKFLKVDLQRRLGLNEYELACQCLLPTRRGDDPNFDDKLDDSRQPACCNTS